MKINEDILLKQITTEISREIQAQAEPVIQQSIRDFEAQLRAKVAVIATAHADKWCEVTRDRNVIQIRIQMSEGHVTR
jgi:F0F1-type ATP synthase membrane subunit b/b'